MRAAGIIAEYNPFHNGHSRHIAETRARSGCEYVVVAMNGSFSQRGEPMCLSKWTRTEMALAGGADVVIELPALYGVRPAEGFARGGVRLLESLGCVDTLSFGCETEDIDALASVARLIDREPDGYRARLKEGLAHGMSFARARGEAIRECAGVREDWLSAPNAALAIEYLRENDRLRRPMRPLVVLRGAAHAETALYAETSASAIRLAMARGDTDAALCCVPETSRVLLRDRWPVEAPRACALDDLTLFALRSMDPERLSSLPDMCEGLESRIWKLAADCSSREELLAACKCKRYPYARLSRLLAHALLGGSCELVSAFPFPPYARVLGFRRSAASFLSYICAASAVPVVTRPKALGDDPVFAFDRRATDIRALLSELPSARYAGQDYTQRLLVV